MLKKKGDQNKNTEKCLLETIVKIYPEKCPLLLKLNFKLGQNSKTISLFQNNSSTHQPTKNPTSLRSRVF
jgi:hypothetical protein